ncbi:unnamed protein product [Prunus brigantina]
MDDGLVSPISSKNEIPKVGKLTHEECLTFSSFLWGPPIPPGECKFCLKVDEHYWSNCPVSQRKQKLVVTAM